MAAWAWWLVLWPDSKVHVRFCIGKLTMQKNRWVPELMLLEFVGLSRRTQLIGLRSLKTWQGAERGTAKYEDWQRELSRRLNA